VIAGLVDDQKPAKGILAPDRLPLPEFLSIVSAYWTLPSRSNRLDALKEPLRCSRNGATPAGSDDDLWHSPACRGGLTSHTSEPPTPSQSRCAAGPRWSDHAAFGSRSGFKVDICILV
jgi:hypothetical protein